jgi:hypothetical protein
MPLLVGVLVFFTCQALAQDLHADRRVDWAGAGYPGCIPSPTRVVEAGAHGLSTQNPNNGPALMAALQALGGQPGVVRLPAGTFRVGQTLALPSGAVLRGAGSTKTKLLFDFGGTTDRHALAVETEPGTAFTPLTGGFTKNSRTVTTAVPLNLTSGDYAEIRQANGAWDTKPAPWAAFSVGQIVRVTGAAGTQVSFEKSLRLDYDPTLRPEIRKLVPITDVGIESLTIERADRSASGGGSNVSFRYAARGWLRDVESIRSIGSHVLADASTQLEITGNFFHEALTYDGASTRGYGVTLIQHTGECLVENNVLATLRHALMVKQGANGNVIAYNFSTDPKRVENPTDAGGDLSLHGHFPFANLFEGNIAQTLHLDQAWGPAGPGNTFLRNRLERYGLLMTPGPVNADGQNFIGNDLTGTGTNFGNYLLAGTDHVAIANRVRGTWQPAAPTSPLADSYFRTTTYDFWDASPWPSLGSPTEPGQGTLPARQRYRGNGPKTVLQTAHPPTVDAQSVPGGYLLTASPARSYAWSTGQTTREITVERAGNYTLTVTNDHGCATRRSVEVGGEVAPVTVFPNPSEGSWFWLREGRVDALDLFDATGRRHEVDWTPIADEYLVRPRRPLPPGGYLLRLRLRDGTVQTRRFVVR